MPTLKPFVLNQSDLNFIYNQVTFKPLFDNLGNAIINWSGVGNVYDGHGNLIGTGAANAADTAAVAAAIALYGHSYSSTTSLEGIRDVSGLNNNLLHTTATLGAVDQPFRRDVAANFAGYLQPTDALAPNAFYASKVYHQTVNASVAANGDITFHYTTGAPDRVLSATIGDLNYDAGYAALYDATASLDTVTSVSINAHTGELTFQYATLAPGVVLLTSIPAYNADLAGQITSDGTTLLRHSASGATTPAQPVAPDYATTVDGLGVVHQSNVIDYTARMISLTTTTAGATPLLDAQNHVVNWDTALYASDTTYQALIDSTGINIATLVEGAAIVTGYGLLETLGHKDFQKAPGTEGSNEYFIGGENPGVAPTNGWFALFGQFFDHGLDLIGKGGQGTTIKIALATDDPLYGVIGSDGRPTTSITISRATVSGKDANGDPTYINHTSPFIDQSQTYGSDAQTTALLREWVSSDGGTSYHAGMAMFDGQTLATQWKRADGVMTNQTLPTLNELRDHVLDTNRDGISWEDVLDLRNRDTNGDVVSGTSGHALILDMNPRFDGSHLDAGTPIGNGTDTVDSLVDAAVAILSGATPPGFTFERTGLDTTSGGIRLVVSGGAGAPYHLPDGSYTGASALGLWVNFSDFSITAPPGAVHNAVGQILLAAVGDHYIAGDGRVNENIGLTAIHHVFHEEHNFQIQNVINTINTQDAAVSPTTHDELHRWQINTGTTDANGNFINTVDNSIAWDQDKMFNAAKLIVEMEYQHAAVDQYARTITPHIQEFVGYSSGADSTVSLEFSQSAFRFGHSTLRETIDVIDPSHGLTGKIMSFALERAFLNPELFAQIGPGGIALGMSHQQMNEVDEFITPALNQGLLGLPLDLAAINIARGRDLGIPTLNEFREQVGLAKYVSWDDFQHNMIHPESLTNFIAAYAFDGNVVRANAIAGLFNGSITEGSSAAMGYTAQQATAFMHNESGAPAGATAFNLIDTWLGGLAEAHVPGGLLGSTFDLVFTTQIESLMDGDRFYYLQRLFGQQFGEEVGNGQFKDIVERNTGLTHLNGSILAYADKYYDLGANDSNGAANSHQTEHKYGEILTANPTLGMWTDGSASASSINSNGSLITVNGVTYIRDYRPNLAPSDVHTIEGTPTSGADSHEVLVGTDRVDYLHMRGGDDTAYGEGGNDIIFGDVGNDRLYGGDGSDWVDSGDGADLVDGGSGDDTIFGFGSGSEIGGFDQLVGGDGNDTIWGGEGVDKLSGGAGDDVLYGEGNTDPFTRGGDGNDYVDGGSGGDLLYGDNGDDLIVGGNDQDLMEGGSGDDIIRPGRPSAAVGGGPDEVIGGDGLTDTGFDLMDFSDYAVGPTGVIADMATQLNPLIAIDPTTPFPAWFQMEGVIGTQNSDTITGESAVAGGRDGGNWLIGASGSDTLRGNGGNDVLIGGSIRLDSLIGTYANSYTSNIDGASHRTSGPLGTNGLLDAAGTGTFGKHFTEFLKTDLFKNHVLGDGSADTSATDTAVFVGDRSDYDISIINFVDAHGAPITAYKIVGARGVGVADGTDLIVGIESAKFADITLAASRLLNTGPLDIKWNGITPSDTALPIANTVIANLDTVDTNAEAGPWIYSLRPGSSAGFTVSAAGVVTATAALAANATYTLNLRSLNTGGVYYNETITIQTGTTAINSINGTGLDNVIYALGNNDILNGGAGNDTLFGQAGNDTLIGGTGMDNLVGGGGNDTYDVDDTGDVITEGILQGTDTILTSLNSYSLVALPNIENLTYTGAGDFTGTGNGAVNRIQGSGGNDRIDGGLGNDTMIGGLGNDTFVVSAQTDIITELAGQGTDTVESSGTFTIAALANLENITLTGGAAANATGNASDNVLLGNSGNNILNGGLGADTMSGNAGDDTYVVDNAGDIVTENALEGTDTVQTSLQSYTLSDNVENLTIISGSSGNRIFTGNGSNNIITTGSGNDTIDGGAGIDTMIGGSGNDIYTVDEALDIVTEASGAGADTIRTTLHAYSLAALANVENLTFIGGGSGAFTGTGNGAANTITGGDGDDRIDGGLGTDTMIGGIGDDTYIASTQTDLITELSSEGIDTVEANVTFSIAAAGYANVENITLTGSTAINATGNAADNVLRGNSGNNILNGGLGADTVIGGLGNDTYVVDNSGDIVTENALEGTDTVQTSLLNYTLADNVENLTIVAGSVGDRNFTGNVSNNSITGGSGNDTINGGAGNDTMIGGSGNDTYYVDVSNADADLVNNDIVTESSAGGVMDEIKSTANSYTLGINVENLTFIGSGNFVGTGNSIANTIIGGNGNDMLNGGSGGDDILNGGLGADAMTGGSGNDTYYVDNAGDSVIETSLSLTEIDTVMTSLNSYMAGTNVENIIFTGASGFFGNGNGLANAITGGIGNDALSGGAGADRLVGNAGNDILSGGTQNDVFVFSQTGFGNDTVADFDFDPTGGQDILDLTGLNVTFADMTISASASDTFITFIGSGDSILLTGVSSANVDSSDFIFGGPV